MAGKESCSAGRSPAGFLGRLDSLRRGCEKGCVSCPPAGCVLKIIWSETLFGKFLTGICTVGLEEVRTPEGHRLLETLFS